ncbi:UPF0291 protein [Philodulcilactobacillus myokoensis]|uniref:UPF0291 protein WR164_09410 n=1 Tax=Philodulcilactobacillus myokoensis TaxID=2929573 RepID=A0A9W6B170_9LACO|nr:DUF896 domain-containing protein [Philodulcilactobacillus myokoensis]GLB46962.1 UPF0291 protein [Philodulcilactobacillus myokoensis]
MAMDPVFKKILPRINELAHKSKKEGLTDDERAEQKQLRKKYLKRFRSNFKKQLEMTKVYDKKGNEVTPKKVRKIQRKKGLR